MANKYVLKASTQWPGCDAEIELKDFTDKDYELYEGVDKQILESCEDIAKEAIGMEWYIEKIED